MPRPSEWRVAVRDSHDLVGTHLKHCESKKRKTSQKSHRKTEFVVFSTTFEWLGWTHKQTVIYLHKAVSFVVV